MSICKLKKITIYGLIEKKRHILENLQKLGCLHLIPLSKKDNFFRAENTISDIAVDALLHLQNCPNKRRLSMYANQPVNQLINKVLDNKRQMMKLFEQREKLLEQIKIVLPWGDFKLPSYEVNLWFYIIRKNKMQEFLTLNYPHEVVHVDHKNCYVVIVSQKEPDNMPVQKVDIGYHSLSELQKTQENIEYLLDEVQLERESLTRWIHIIERNIARIKDSKFLNYACSVTLSSDKMFLVSGWVPVDREQEVSEFIKQHDLAAILEKPQKQEMPPSLINYGKKTGGGADTVLFFTTPAYYAWDPGTVLFFSFSLFFGMIMNDAIYSLIFGLIIAIFHKKMTNNVITRRLRTMFYFMSLMGIIWGILVGSYFGIEPNENSFLATFHIIEMNDYVDMMKLSVIIGALHIIIANLVVLWKNRTYWHCLANAGWCLLIVGGFSYWLSDLGDLPPIWEKSIDPVLMVLGALMILFFNSDRPINSFKNILLRFRDGLNGLWHITGAFGDILSYMRLFALGLAGTSLAITFNSMAMQIYHSMPGAGVFFCVLIFIFGHVLNLALSVMAAFVHGIRLNIIEFLKWALSGDGYPFKPFKKLEESN